MTPFVKGLVIAAAHVALVASLGAKLLYDRSVRPRVWVQAAPFDPMLPIRGRYVSLQLTVEVNGGPAATGLSPQTSVTLGGQGDRLGGVCNSVFEAG